MNNKKPEFTHRLNRMEVAVWQNSNETSIWHNITFQKYYKDNEGKLQATNHLKMEDLPNIAFLAQSAYAYLASQESKDSRVPF